MTTDQLLGFYLAGLQLCGWMTLMFIFASAVSIIFYMSYLSNKATRKNGNKDKTGGIH